MRTPDPDPATRRSLLEAAEDLMLRKGFVASTVDEICAAAKVTKGSFFHYFDSKEELGKAALGRFSEKQRAMMFDACAAVDDPLERVYAVIDCMVKVVQKGGVKGCLVGTFAQEVSHTHPELRDACRASFDGFAKAVAADLIAAKERYAPRASFDARGLGNLFLALAQGSLLVLKTTGDRKAMEGNLLHLKRYLETLYGK